MVSCLPNNGGRHTAPAHRGVYHWKTTYNPSQWELEWMTQHKIDRLYIKLFDIEPGAKNGYDDWSIVPVATTRFKQKLPKEIEVVPVVYITTDALRILAQDFYWSAEASYAELIVKRIEDMMKEHYEGRVKEVQLDCDWTEKTQNEWFAFCRKVRRLLHERGMTLSGTVRLHQMRLLESPPEEMQDGSEMAADWVFDEQNPGVPFDRSLLMCYNTGRLQDPKTKNSILDFNDAEPYLRQCGNECMQYCDVAYPVYGWGVEFDESGRFVRLINSHDLPPEAAQSIREEWGETEDIKQMQKALPKLDKDHTTVLFHLDSLNLSKYSHDEIEAFYSR